MCCYPYLAPLSYFYYSTLIKVRKDCQVRFPKYWKYMYIYSFLLTFHLYSDSNKSVIRTFNAFAIFSNCMIFGDVFPLSILFNVDLLIPVISDNFSKDTPILSRTCHVFISIRHTSDIIMSFILANIKKDAATISAWRQSQFLHIPLCVKPNLRYFNTIQLNLIYISVCKLLEKEV